MHYLYFTLLILCFYLLPGKAQVLQFSNGARSNALGDIRTVLIDEYAIFNNQAAAVFNNSGSVAASTMRKFMLSDLHYSSIGASIPFEKNNCIGLVASYNGFDQYNQTKAGINYSRLISDRVSIGAQFDYLARNILEYGTHQTMTFEVGALARVNSQLLFGVHLFNPIRANSGYYADAKYPSYLALGIAYQPSKSFLICAETENNYFTSNMYKIGVEYKPSQNIYFRGGVNNNNLSFGLGMKFRSLQFDICSAYHQYLGISPSGSLIYTFKPSE
jgi:hypothetical protein